jgi:hypothetical protein
MKDYGGHFQKEAREAWVMFQSRDARKWELVQPDPVLTLFNIR